MAEIPLFFGGGIAPRLRMMSKGGKAQKGGGGSIAPNPALPLLVFQEFLVFCPCEKFQMFFFERFSLLFQGS